MASTRTSKQVELVVQLERWESGRERSTWRRRPANCSESRRDGKDTGRARPERRVLVEVAARNQLLRSSGHHSARRLVRRVNRGLRLPAVDVDADVEPGRGSLVVVAGEQRRRADVRQSDSTRGEDEPLDGEERHAARCARPPSVTVRRAHRFRIRQSQAIRALEDLGSSASTTCRSPCCRCSQITLRAGSEMRARPSSSTCAKANC